MPIRARLPYDAKVIEPDRFISEVWKNYLVSLEQDADTGFVQSVTGTANRITITGTATDPIVDISSAYDAAITAQIAAYAQPLDGDLTAIAALTGTGFLKKTAPNTWALDASVLGTTLTDSHIFVGNALNIAADVAMSGDATLANTGALTLATVATAGTTGGSTAIPVITIDAKGRTTSITTAAVVAPAGTLTGTTLAANVVSSSLTSVGTLVSGTWNAATIAIGYGGTGLTGVGTANQSFGTNAAANGFEHKAMTVTSAGAVAGVTTLNASGDITTTAGSIYLAPYPKGIFGYGESTSIITWDASNIYMNFQGSRTGIIMYGGSSGSFTWGINLGTYMTLNTTALTVNTNITGNFITANSGIQTSSLYATDNVSIGAAVNDAYAFNVEGSLTSSASQVGGRIDVTASSAATTFGRGLYVRMSTAAASYTLADMNVVEAAEPTVGAGSSITNLRYFYTNTTAAVATHKYGLFIEEVAGGVTTNRAIHTAGAGDVRLGYMSGGVDGRFVVSSSDGVLSASSAAFPTTATTGDILYASATDTWSRLALGTALQVLHVNSGGTQVEWGSVTGTGNVMYSASPTTTGTLTGAAANFSGAVNVAGNFSVATTRFTVAAASGNTFIAGTLGLNASPNRTGYQLHTTGSTYIENSGAAFDLSYISTGQDSIFIRNTQAVAGLDVVHASIGFGRIDGSNQYRGAAIAAIQTSSDADQTGLNFYVQSGAPSASNIVRAMQIKHDKTVTMDGTLTVTGAATMSSTLGVTGTLTGAAANFSGTVNLSTLTASLPVATDASKNLITSPVTGTGSTVVMSVSPTITGGTLTAPSTLFTNYCGIGGTDSGVLFNMSATSGAYAIGTTARAMFIRPTFPTGATSSMRGIELFLRGADGTYTTTNVYHIAINDITKGSVQTVTNNYGIYIASIVAGGTLNYAIYTNGGLVRFGDAVTAASTLDVTGVITASNLTASLMVATNASKQLVSVAKSAAYTPTNVTTDRAYDADATTLAEVADVLGTLIADLKTANILA